MGWRRVSEEQEGEKDSASGAVLFKSDSGRKCGLRRAETLQHHAKLARIFFRIIPREGTVKRCCGSRAVL